MGEAFITRRGGTGGGPTSSDAILAVTVQTGSTVTMTKGGITLTPTMWVQAADNTLDFALFIIPPGMFDSVNAWTVTATRGQSSASKDIIISSASEYELSIPFTRWLIKDGIVQTGFSFSNSVTYINTYNKGSVETTSAKIVLTANNGYTMTYSDANSTDLRGYSNLKATVNPTNVVTYTSLNAKLRGIGVAVYSSPYPDAGSSGNMATRIAANANTATLGPQELDCDISTLTSGYIAITVGAYGGDNGKTEIYDVWLENRS